MLPTNGKLYFLCCKGHCVQMSLVLAMLWYLASYGYIYFLNIRSAEADAVVYLSKIYDEQKDGKSRNQIFEPDTANGILTNEPEKLKGKSRIPLRFLQNISEPAEKLEDFSSVPDATTLHVDFLQLPRKACDSDRILLVAVKSSIHHFSQRKKIRETWGSYQSNLSARVVFLLGLPNSTYDKETQERIAAESSLYNDVVQGSFVDDYFNLTVKSIMGLRWFHKSCRSSKYFMLVDDDVYLDLKEILSHYSSGSDSSDNVLHCGEKTIMRARVVRRGRWATPFRIYNFTHYPPYCGGVCYIMSQDVASALYTISLKTHTDISVDDAMISGIIREKAGIEMERMPKGLCVNLINSYDIEEKLQNMWEKGVRKKN